jgi:tetratricopeptide (TPR) repeat protein
MEVVYRYANLLLQFNRLEEAILVAETCLKLDPYNAQVRGIIDNLQGYKKQQRQFDQARNNLQRLEEEWRKSPTNLQAAFNLVGVCLQTQQTNRAIQILDGLLLAPGAESNAVLNVVQAYARMAHWPKLEAAMEKLVKVMPGSPEAWYDLAALKANLGKPAEAFPALGQALTLSAQRRQSDPQAPDLVDAARNDKRFKGMRPSPEFQKLVPPL